MMTNESQQLKKYLTKKKHYISKKELATKKLDKNGIILYKIPYTKYFQYFPVCITNYALGNFDKFIETNNNIFKNIFLKQANWLNDNITIKNKTGFWEHHFRLPYYKFDRIPWVHGMAQGQGISVLLRAYQITKKNYYYKKAIHVFNSFNNDFDSNGVQFIDEDGNIWFEEYAIQPPPHVLNGFIFALFGLYELYYVNKDIEVFKKWNLGIKTLKSNLYKYNANYWSYYNLAQKYPAPINYHKIHIQQLNILYDITKIKTFKIYADKWQNNLNNYYYFQKANLIRNVERLKNHGLIHLIWLYKKRRKWLKYS